MPYLLIRFPKSERVTTDRPERCPHCGSTILQRWGKTLRTDINASEAHVYNFRYRCGACHRTFQHSVERLDSLAKMDQVQKVAGLAWALGMSCREVVKLFAKVELQLSRMTVWREGQQFLDPHPDRPGWHRRFSLDHEYVQGVSKKLGVVIVVELGQDHALVLGTLDEYNPQVVKSWLVTRLQDWRVEIIVANTAILSQYNTLTSGSLLSITG